MILASFRQLGMGSFVGARISETELVDLSPLIPGLNSSVSAMRQLLKVTAGRPDFSAAELDRLRRVRIDDAVLEPVVPDPTKIVAAPVNYRDHQEEMAEDYGIEALGVFLKAPSSVLGHGGVVQLPYTDRRFDQEGELAAVIGRTARSVPVADALEVVAGYTCCLDMTMRGGEDRSTRKSFDTFTPVGPYVVTPDEVGDLAELQLRTTVNGTLRQDTDIADLVWDVPRLVSYASSVMTLYPGDIVTTGTPAGIGQIADGDVISVDIDRLGTLSVSVSATGAVACPTRGAQRGPKPPSGVTPVRRRD
ncbi:2-keto-4-pentenoate hydratase/2-oxohepta-3-ene-1,7-dioic acid hydratase in catechol pathway [Mycobacterium sp. OAS707]|uniref:fumarylacetoacetate hydrolase family protein n=1 Tax=Mycobacterium sp. OAS707 TaxID=2663822 RepID=UPI0019E39E05|nr:fumarylacetoacetate hydrolase family protein [Mycobacterium sp. OAS707]MBE1549593.1 2-keto-4-pentenoate hydratase/2-oxohepta-3-ene-1,7-dioic acid hydratase in catechol pathway [Mycobacterium sp. OAS707]